MSMKKFDSVTKEVIGFFFLVCVKIWLNKQSIKVDVGVPYLINANNF